MTTRVQLALPTEDRVRAHAFVRALGLPTPGEPAADGVPEPLEAVLGAGVSVVYVPTGGFGWVTGRPAAGRDTAECLIALVVDAPADVDALLADAEAGGGVVVTSAAEQPWGYAGTVADPDSHLWQVTSGR